MTDTAWFTSHSSPVASCSLNPKPFLEPWTLNFELVASCSLNLKPFLPPWKNVKFGKLWFRRSSPSLRPLVRAWAWWVVFSWRYSAHDVQQVTSDEWWATSDEWAMRHDELHCALTRYSALQATGYEWWAGCGFFFKNYCNVNENVYLCAA